MTLLRLEIEARAEFGDALADATAGRMRRWLGEAPESLRTRKVYLLELETPAAELPESWEQRVLDALCDPVAERGAIDQLPVESIPPQWQVEVGFAPGVTDAVGASVLAAAGDALGQTLQGRAYSATQYRLWGFKRESLDRAVAKLLHNPLIERASVAAGTETLAPAPPRAGSAVEAKVESVALREASDDELLRISSEGMLALSLGEMKAIAAHYRELGREPTDAELECLAQTWSEHCKHKIFASPIDYVDPDGASHSIERGLFRRYIRGATEAIGEARREAGLDPEGEDFLVSVFHDNAGVVRLSEHDHLVYKVETHNSPSALDPFGGSMTGIVGVNRDAFGTGRGADLLTNVWGYCLGPADYAGELPPGLMHPRRIRDGVHGGVIDGGNHSGIPYARGFELFDARYVGKPLVYCGTVSVMPVELAGKPTHEKYVEPGDKIVMVGGRIGKDGIHGATFSSVELDESSPVQAVQIGDPITQKMMFDMLAEAGAQGLYSGMTDNGAGGLSSSIGEMAEATNGARIDLAKAPLKYPGLAPWEILISEAQERMSLAVPPEKLEAFLALAQSRGVEASVLGEFTDSGRFEVSYGELQVADLSLEFLHEGLPLPTLSARWSPPEAAPADPKAEAQASVLDADPGALLRMLLARPNSQSTEGWARHYDHEVKGLSVIKPWVGVNQDVPSPATVTRVRHGRPEGVVLAEGIHPHYSDHDTESMATACVDEAVRRVLCAGARWDRLSALDNFCWPDPIVSDRTPDGEHKLAQLVRCCQGLDAACQAYGVPLISGKDSMKNDAFLGGVKISIPPTLLVSVMGQLPDVSKALDQEVHGEGWTIWCLGATRDELGGSELARGLGLAETAVPRTRLESNAKAYQAFCALRDAGRVAWAHAPGRGGLAVALGQVAMASAYGLKLKLDAAVRGELSLLRFLASESTGRIIFGAPCEHDEAIRGALSEHGLQALGQSVTEPGLGIEWEGGSSHLGRDTLRRAFGSPTADAEHEGAA